jgi:hypothetical protein
VTRANDRSLRTDRGIMVKNRAVWTVVGATGDRFTGTGLTVTGSDGTVTLPGHYLHSSVELGYAETVHAAQGRTVDHGILVADAPLDGRALYVGMTRGRADNHAYVRTPSNRTAVDVLAAAIAADWADTPAIDVRADLTRRHARPHLQLDQRRIPGLLPEPRLRELVRERDRFRHLDLHGHKYRLRQLDDDQRTQRAGLAELTERRHHILGELNAALTERAALHAWQRSPRRDLSHRIQRLETELRGVGPELARHHDTVHARQPELDAARQWVNDHRADYARQQLVEDRLALDVDARALQAGRDTPPYLVAEIGPRPNDPRSAKRWDRTAGLAEQYRAAHGIDHPDYTLGRAPSWEDDLHPDPDRRDLSRAIRQTAPGLPSEELGLSARHERDLQRSIEPPGIDLGLGW